VGNTNELKNAAMVFQGYIGNRTAYNDFSYGDLPYQCTENAPVGINPLGCTKNGENIDGALPDDLRRGQDTCNGCTVGSWIWPPLVTGYPWEAMQGLLAQAEIFYRAGYDSYEWSDRALLRAAQFLYRISSIDSEWIPTGDDEWQVHLLKAAYGSSFEHSGELPARFGKNVGFTDWTHSVVRVSGPPSGAIITIPPAATHQTSKPNSAKVSSDNSGSVLAQDSLQQSSDNRDGIVEGSSTIILLDFMAVLALASIVLG
jgi:hypothetical protein